MAPAEDRISVLHDSIIVRILSLLKMRHIVRTSVLSRRWQYIWTFVPFLTFDIKRYSNPGPYSDEFVAWVNKALFRFWNTRIEKLEVIFTYESCFASDVNTWVRFALEKNVKDLVLDFDSAYDDDFYLPQTIYCNSALESLSVTHCEMAPRGALSWTSLERLTISYTSLNDSLVAKILLGSPKLQYLNLRHSYGIHHLYIISDSLRELVIDDCYRLSDELKNEPHFEISAPNIHSLGLLRRFDRHCRFINVSSLNQAELDFIFHYDHDDDVDVYEGYYMDYVNDCIFEFGKLVESLSHVVQLDIGHQCIQGMLILDQKGLMSPLLHLKCLNLNVPVDQYDVPGIISLLKYTPNLEQLVVNKRLHDLQYIPGSNFKKLVEKFWNSEKKIEKFPLSHLKSVKFNGFREWKDVNEFTMKLGHVLLKNAPLIEKIVFLENDGLLENIAINMKEHQMFITRVA